MIPYAIFMMNFIWKDASLEVRGLDPVSNGISFRLARPRAVQLFLEGRPEKIDCLFLENDKRTYRKVTLTDFVIREEPGSASDPGFVCYSLISEQPDFTEALAKLLKDYTQYIRTRLSADELSAMEEMTGRLVGDDYPSSLAEWQEMVRKQGRIPEKESKGETRSGELAVCLDSPKTWEAFLTLEKDAFAEFYWEENGLTGHPITGRKITHIYMGNSFCPLLFPKEEEAEKILARAETFGLKPVFVFSTMPEYLVGVYRKRIEWILQKAGTGDRTGKDSKTDGTEIVINDPGTAALLKELLEEKEEIPHISLILGPLLDKRKRDVRMDWRLNSKIDRKANRESALDSTVFREYLKSSFGIERVSYQACGYPIKVTGAGNDLYLPLYQTNTSGTCTLYALCKNGDREAQEEIADCPHYCDKNMVFYPRPLPMIGRWNSLFGCDMKLLNDDKALGHYLNSGIRRLVVRM